MRRLWRIWVVMMMLGVTWGSWHVPEVQAQDGLACLRGHLKKAFKLEELGELPSAAKYYRKALACPNPPTSQLQFARARLASFHMKADKCRSCAIFQLCQIKTMPVASLPQKMVPQAKSLFRLIKGGELKCPAKGAKDLQKDKYLLYKTSKATKKSGLKLKLKVIDMSIQSSGLVYTLPGKVELKEKKKPCKPGTCTFKLTFGLGKKQAKPMLKYHYRLYRNGRSDNLHGPLGTRFRKVLVPEALFKKKGCADLKGAPHNPKSSPDAIIAWMQTCQKLGKAKGGTPKWVWPVVAGVGGLLVGAAVGVVVTYVVLK